MKILYTILFAVLACSVVAQSQNDEPENMEELRKFWDAKKEMYVDNLLKKRIPPVLNDNYYSKIELQDYARDFAQGYDETGHIHRLYLFTTKANSGFRYINKETNEFLESLPNGTNVTYILNDRKVSTEEDVERLIALKETEIQNLKYRRSDSGEELIVTVVTE